MGRAELSWVELAGWPDMHAARKDAVVVVVVRAVVALCTCLPKSLVSFARPLFPHPPSDLDLLQLARMYAAAPAKAEDGNAAAAAACVASHKWRLS